MPALVRQPASLIAVVRPFLAKITSRVRWTEGRASLKIGSLYAFVRSAAARAFARHAGSW
jgi:hypothetical protein